MRNFIRLFILGLFLFGQNQSSYSKSFTVKVKFYYKDSLVLLNDNFSINFLTNNDTIATRISKDTFYVEKFNVSNFSSVVFKYNNIVLCYNNIKLNKADLGKCWTFKLHSKPFVEQDYWYLKDVLEKIEWLYTLNTGQGIILTAYRFSPCPVMDNVDNESDLALPK